MPKARLGVALLVPPPFDVQIDALRRAMADPALGRIDPHITLVPPVNVREDDLGAAVTVLRDAAAATRPFTVVIGPPASFLPANPVLYLSVGAGAVDVRALRDRVFRLPLERKLTHPFVPHVTIADEADPGRIDAALTAMADFRVRVTFDRVHLLREGEGRKWTPIGDWQFGGRAVVGRGGLELEITTGQAPDPEAEAFARREWPQADLDVFGSTGFRAPIALTGRRAGEVVAVASGYVSASRGHLSELVVAASARREGIGSQLLAAFTSRAAELGATFLTLSTAADGPARTFYERHGWRVTDVLPKENFDRDFVRMRRDL